MFIGSEHSNGSVIRGDGEGDERARRVQNPARRLRRILLLRQLLRMHLLKAQLSFQEKEEESQLGEVKVTLLEKARK